MSQNLLPSLKSAEQELCFSTDMSLSYLLYPLPSAEAAPAILPCSLLQAAPSPHLVLVLDLHLNLVSGKNFCEISNLWFLEDRLKNGNYIFKINF